MADTNAYMTSVGENATFTTKITTVATDWLKVQGDKQHAPIQRTFGDYISLASDTNGDLMAAWTDGRSGQARIMTKRIKSMPIVKRIA